MRHVFDALDFISEPIMAIRKKYGLEGYGIYMVARHLLYFQRMKSLELETLVHLMRIHAQKPEAYIREYLDDCLKHKALHSGVYKEVLYVYHIDSVMWYLAYCKKNKTVTMKICGINNDNEQYMQIYERFKHIIDADWTKLYAVQQRVGKYDLTNKNKKRNYGDKKKG